MRLLYTTDDGSFGWTGDLLGDKIPSYAILSHTWKDKQEVTFADLKDLDNPVGTEIRSKEGYQKLLFCAQQAKRDGLKYFWVDTCCIDKTNNTELSEAINSMFRWYQNAVKCYVFLSDVEDRSLDADGESCRRWKAAFRKSRWFHRGWTLQELLAPRSVEFFSRDRIRLGDKDLLKQTLHEVTGIPIKALSGSDLSEFDVAERFSWAANRQTTREEDGAYCLLGIFGIFMPLIYGEGKTSAMKRLQKEVGGTPEGTAGQKERLGKMCSWLSAPDPSTNYHKAHKHRQAKTGIWLLNSPSFIKWKASSASRLWLYGIPGCGKTILSSTVIEHLLQHCYGDPSMVTAYFYLDFNDTQKQNPELMFRSLLCQLLRRSVAISEGVNALFSACANGHQQPSLHAILEIIPQLIKQFTHVYVVLDALDECTQRQELMDILEMVASWQLDNLHLLMTSRKERDIENSLGSYIKEEDTVCLQQDVVDGDIQRYVRQRLSDDKSLTKWNTDAIRQEIEAKIMHGARGMYEFRWAVCQLDTLAQCRSRAMLRKSLATLPRTLDQTYDRILAAISEQDRDFAMRILRWLTFSERPMSVEEIAEVVAIDVARQPAFDRDEVLEDPLEALNICSSLVAITTNEPDGDEWTKSPIIALAHYSVREYLVSERIKQGQSKQYSMQAVECHNAIAEDCLQYLLQFQQPISPDDVDEFALARYTAEFWNSHFRKIGDDTNRVSRAAMSLMSTEQPAYLTWIQLWDPDAPWKAPCLEKRLESTAMPLYYAALLDLRTITRILLDKGTDVNAQGGEHGNALNAASVKNHEQIVKILLKAGADMSIQNGYYGNALQAASSNGHERVVKILVDAGADVDIQRSYCSNALHEASSNGHERIVKMLVDAGANVDAQDIWGCTALEVASTCGHKRVVKMLLDAGAVCRRRPRW